MLDGVRGHRGPGRSWPRTVMQSFMTPSGLAGWVTGGGREVLLLHGGPGMTDYMAGLLPELEGYRVASFQQRGVARRH